ncbi:MAG TPA: hypothetical protein VKR43_19435 [Bryobacteraceae bacterium]|nr:hypothetical protein [Bryobacteraceae bacterium]
MKTVRLDRREKIEAAESIAAVAIADHAVIDPAAPAQIVVPIVAATAVATEEKAGGPAAGVPSMVRPISKSKS